MTFSLSRGWRWWWLFRIEREDSWTAVRVGLCGWLAEWIVANDRLGEPSGSRGGAEHAESNPTPGGLPLVPPSPSRNEL